MADKKKIEKQGKNAQNLVEIELLIFLVFLYWSSSMKSWPRMVPQKSTVSNVFGSRAFERYRNDLTLLEAASRNVDGENVFARLVKHSTAALLNSYARKGYPYSAWEANQNCA
ncbi:hypothetical protein ACJIZ3_004932 [Penstemon smallii]|uniref:Uncharacterized protein n=1 Tax=Penstemon smallii TaxID=265156 RepID=A0ABD3S3K1_9LAMI